MGGLIFGGAYIRREICVSKSAGLIIGGKFVSPISPCANDNIGALTRNSWQLNLSEHANFKHKKQQLYWKWKFGFRLAGSNFLANTSSMDRRSPRREWGVHHVNNNKPDKKKLNHNGTDMCYLLWFILYLRANPKYKPQGTYIRRVFAFRSWGAYIRRGLFSGFYGTSIGLSQSLKTLADVNVGRFWLLDLRKRSTEQYPCCDVFDRSDITLKSVNPKAVWNNNSTFREDSNGRFVTYFRTSNWLFVSMEEVRVILRCRNVLGIYQSTPGCVRLKPWPNGCNMLVQHCCTDMQVACAFGHHGAQHIAVLSFALLFAGSPTCGASQSFLCSRPLLAPRGLSARNWFLLKATLWLATRSPRF